MTPLADQIQFLSYVRYKKQDSCKVTIEEKTKCIYHKESAKTQKEQKKQDRQDRLRRQDKDIFFYPAAESDLAYPVFFVPLSFLCGECICSLMVTLQVSWYKKEI
jgi:uncharacterized protein (DUF2344 family)